MITPAVLDLRRRRPDAEVRTRHLDWHDTHALPEGRIDALVARLPLPVPADRLEVTVLYAEPRVLVVPTTHRLAGRTSVTAGDFAGEGLVPCASDASAWSGTSDHAEDHEDKLELVAGGRAVAVLPAGDRRASLRPGLVTIPISGLDPCQVVLATRVADGNSLVGDFRSSAQAQLTG